jgi:hypothetical protein
MAHRKYRTLERECHLQAAITGHKEAREELKKMEREYKAMADWLESHPQAPRQTPSQEQGN